MSRSIRFCFVALVLSGLAACTTTQEVAAAREYAPGAIVQDVVYVEQVERMARSRGVSVHWVNPPIRRVPVADN